MSSFLHAFTQSLALGGNSMEIKCSHCERKFVSSVGSDIRVPPETKSILCPYCGEPIPIVTKRPSEKSTEN
jgi:DNA-directed RNA polymerase subunit RPC12/RpoP